MKSTIAFVGLITATLFLSGCGLKGPLYFPKEPNGQQQGQKTGYDQDVFKKSDKKSENL